MLACEHAIVVVVVQRPIFCVGVALLKHVSEIDSLSEHRPSVKGPWRSHFETLGQDTHEI